MCVKYDAAKEDDIDAMLDPKLCFEDIQQPEEEEVEQAKSDSKLILSAYCDATGSKGRMSYFKAPDFCRLHGEHYNWGEYHIQFAIHALTQDLISTEFDQCVLSDEEYPDVMKDFKNLLSAKTGKDPKSDIKKREKEKRFQF